MDTSADQSDEDRDRALRRRRFLTAGGGVVLAGLLTGCNFNRQGAGTGDSSTTSPGAGSTSSSNPLSGNSSSNSG
jgi:hypothetical protein